MHEPPHAGARIPKLRYLSPDFLRLEIERVFRCTWHMAGPVADLDRVGAYFTFDIGGESAIVVRTEEGVRAMHNVCVHRGRALREPGLGHAQSFRCPFHHWEYELDGRVRHHRCGGVSRIGVVPAPDAGGGGSVRGTRVGELRARCRAARLLPRSTRPAPGRVSLRGLRVGRGRYARARMQLEGRRRRVQRGVPPARRAPAAAAGAGRNARRGRARRPALLHPRAGRIAEPELGGPPGLGDDQRHLLREAGIDPARFEGGPSAVRAAINRHCAPRPNTTSRA